MAQERLTLKTGQRDEDGQNSQSGQTGAGSSSMHRPRPGRGSNGCLDVVDRPADRVEDGATVRDRHLGEGLVAGGEAGRCDRPADRKTTTYSPNGRIDLLKGDRKNGNRNGSLTVKSNRIEGYGPPHNRASRIQSVDHPTAPQQKAESPNTCVLRRRRSRLKAV